MKLSDILLLTLFFVMGSMVFAIKQMQKTVRPDNVSIPVPTIKPVAAKAQTAISELRLQLSTPETAGSYGRLSLDQFLARTEPEITLHETAPRAAAEQRPSSAPLRQEQNTPQLDMQLKPMKIETAESISLPNLSIHEEAMFMDRVVEMAAASPIRPASRDCGTLNPNFKSAKKTAKVRSVAMQRQLTDRTSIGVEYVYKDGCYKNAIANLGPLNMPGDDGVNLRINMRF